MGKCWGHSDQGAANRKGAAQWRYTPVQTTPGYLRQQSRPHSGFTAVSVPFVQLRGGRAPAASAVRESQLCTSRPLISALLVARAPPAPIQRAYCQHWKCRVLQGIYIPSSPI